MSTSVAASARGWVDMRERSSSAVELVRRSGSILCSEVSAAHNGTAMVTAATAAASKVRSRRRMKRSSLFLFPIMKATAPKPGRVSSGTRKVRCGRPAHRRLHSVLCKACATWRLPKHGTRFPFCILGVE